MPSSMRFASYVPSFRSLACLGLLVAAACASAPVPAPVALPAPVSLGEPELAAIAGLMRLEDERRLDTAVVGQFARGPNPEIRRRAVLSMGRIGDRRATAALLASLSDSARDVRREAAFALGELGDTSIAVVAALANRIRSDEAAVAAEAAAALGKLPAQASFDTVAAVLEGAGGGDFPAEVVAEALLAVWHLPRASRALDRVAPLLASSEPEVRWRAAYAVMRIGTPPSVPLLLPLLSDTDPLVRSLAARGLRRPVTDSATLGGEARAALTAALHDPHPSVRIQAAAALSTHGDPGSAGPIATLLRDPDANVGVAAAQAMPALRAAPSALALLRTASDSAAPTGLRAAALASLVQLDPALGAVAAGEWVAAPRWLLRFHAVRSVSGLEWGAAGPVLSVAARDPNVRVAVAALNAASRAPDTPSAARALFVEGLRRDEPAVRAAAIRGVARQAGPEDLAGLLDAYERASQDTSNVAALAAVDGLGAIRNAGVPVENVFFARFAPPSDPAVLRRVAQRLGGAWPQPELPPPPRRPDAFYLDAARRLVGPAFRGEPAPRLAIRVASGEIVIELAPLDAPLTVLNMITLVESGFYAADADTDRRRWHRVVPNFVLQDGDPRGDGSGGPGHSIRDEINRIRYERGVLGMALSGPDTGGSQFFITHAPQPHLDGGYTIFGRVIAGMDVADRVVQDDPILDMRIIWP